ncbi:diacylglycerol kinase family protein, partial [Enterobacter cloacae subsp. cloacae]
GNDLLRQAITDLREDGARIHVRVTWEKGDAARYIHEGLTLGVETIISGGGDGTINEIASALVDLPTEGRPVMGILPLGTAN